MVCELNKEYHIRTQEHNEYSILSVYLRGSPVSHPMVIFVDSHNKKRYYNYRDLFYYSPHREGTDVMRHSFKLSTRYTYSSGMLHQYAYKK